jgi:non-specific serine/threonine protein kinase
VAGYLAYFRGDHAEALPWLEQSLALRRELEDRRGLATALLYAALAMWAGGDLDRATELFEESADLVRRAGAGTAYATVLAAYSETPFHNLARLAEQRGDLSRVRQMHEEAVAFSRARGDSHGIANALRFLAVFMCRQGEVDRAMVLLKESQRLFHDLADVPCSWNGLALLAYATSLAGCHARAARLLGAAEVQQRASGMALLISARAVHDETVTAARVGLGGDAFAAAWAEGRAMTLEQAVAYALEEPPST